MFGFGKKIDHRAEAIREFTTTCAQLRGADELAQAAVGHAINMANSLFQKRFGTPDTFSRLPSREQFSYIESLAKAVQSFSRDNTDPPSALGFDLFKAWVASLTVNDPEMTNLCAKELAFFSRKGELLGGGFPPSAA